MLTVENLVKDFKNIRAVDNISFKVSPGKIFGILGPNGAGKTTILRVILDILKPTSGSIQFDNRGGKFLKDNLGYLPEERGLYKKSKVVDVLTYFAKLKRLERQTIPGKIDAWLERLEIPNYKNKKIEELSKGNQQKIQFILAVLHNPDILILDEPFSGFDPINQQMIKNIIKDFIKEEKYILLSTHVMEVAELLCSEILLIDEGREVLKGSVKSIKSEYGDETYNIRFKGKADYLNQISGIEIIELGNSEAKILINGNPNDVLKQILDHVELLNFSKVEPTMNHIFLEAVRKKHR